MFMIDVDEPVITESETLKYSMNRGDYVKMRTVTIHIIHQRPARHHLQLRNALFRRYQGVLADDYIRLQEDLE